MTRVNGFYFFDIVYKFIDISEFLAKYEQEERKKDLLNNYLIYCFVYKKFDHIKSIITHFNLDTVNTRLTFNKELFNFDLSMTCFSVFCDDIDFVKYLLQINGQNYVINEDYCDYHTAGDYFNLDKATPLFVAVGYTKNRDMIDFLINNGADINARNATDLMPIMNVTCNEKNVIEYYHFLISRGANINSQNKIGNTALNYVIRKQQFYLALQLIHECKANPFLINNQKRDGLMEFIIYLNIYDGYDENIGMWDFSVSDYDKVNYVEKLLEITKIPNRNLIYELFAACIRNNASLKIEYFNKVKKSAVLHKDYNSIYWQNKFNDIVGNDNDENYYIQSVKVFNRLLHIYDCDTVLYTILYEILDFYEYILHQYDKYNKLLIYILNIITDNQKSFNELYGTASNIYYIIFDKFISFIRRNFPWLLLENILKTNREMIYKIMINKKYLENENNYNVLVKEIHLFIYYLYENSFNDETKRNVVEKYIKDEYPINLTDNDNNSILHTILNDARIFNDEIFEDNNNNEIIINFLYVILKINNFNHINLRNNKNQTPLELATAQDRSKNIIEILLNNGSAVIDLNILHNKYPSLKISDKFLNLTTFAARVVKEQNQDYIPKHLQEIVNRY